MVSRNDPADFVNGPLSASDLNELARGTILDIKLTSDTTPTAALDTILSDSITLADDRRLMFMATCTLRSDIPGGIQARIELDGTQIQRKNSDAVLGNSDTFITLYTQKNVTAGTYTVDFIIGVSGSDGNEVHAEANGETGTHGVCELTVIDTGPPLS